MDKKIAVLTVGAALLILGFGIVLTTKDTSSKGAVLKKIVGAKIEIPHEKFDLKDIGYSKGLVEHKFPIKNAGSGNLEIANLATSCMCTKAYLKTGSGESPVFGMKGHSRASDWKGTIKPGEEAQIVVLFDPAAHGKQGIGPVERFISFETNDSDHPYQEVSFSGKVVQ